MMSKKGFWLLMAIVLIPIMVSAEDLCEDRIKVGGSCRMVTPPTSCLEYTVFLKNGSQVENGTMTSLNTYFHYMNFSQPKGDYWVVLCDNIQSREIRVTSEDEEMASLAITIFVLLITLGVFALPFIVKQFTKNIIADQVLKRLCWVLGLFLLSLDTAMMATLVENAGLGLESEVFRFLWLINWASYLIMMFIVLSFVFNVIRKRASQKKDKRMGT